MPERSRRFKAQAYTSLWDLKDEAEMGHIQLSREADLVVVCPATADLLPTPRAATESTNRQ